MVTRSLEMTLSGGLGEGPFACFAFPAAFHASNPGHEHRVAVTSQSNARFVRSPLAATADDDHGRGFGCVARRAALPSAPAPQWHQHDLAALWSAVEGGVAGAIGRRRAVVASFKAAHSPPPR